MPQVLAQRQMNEPPPFQNKEVKRSIFRQALSKVNIGTSSGYGYTRYQQNLQGNSILLKEGVHYLVPDPSLKKSNTSVVRGYAGWLTNPVDYPNLIASDEDIIVPGDSVQLGLAGSGQSIPLNLSLHINLIDRIKVGGGVAAEWHSIREVAFTEAADILGPYKSNVSSALILRYYGLLGARISRWYFWDFTLDTHIGKKKYTGPFSQESLRDGFYFNVGLLTEKHFSEYFRLTLRPSVEWASYNMDLGTSGHSVKTNTPSFFLQAGISLNYPRLPRCPIDRCHVQLEHVHFGKEYRGQPIYRWQNPKYGQNHPELMRNKKRSKDDTEQRQQYQRKRKKFLFW
ncbi:hypothetical protein [Nafulsella turpanensis]|uniref:hypothetical protein n=1 Tax=Nafulsella turpanensis TaxID=1265690 RepID=UPI00135F12B8|nr:hypothetical protein [Nafulsella turpanensis]